jgi:prepilin-type N-terminal cleavage/methylation domain-containing protein
MASRLSPQSGSRLKPSWSTGFTLIELLLVIAIVSLLVSIILPSLAEARRSAKQSQNVNNLKQFGQSTVSYGTDFKDRIWSFTWEAGKSYGVYTGPNTPLAPQTGGNELEAASWQAIDIIRRRSSPDWIDKGFESSWIPQPTYSHLVLLDYLATKLPVSMACSPEDRFRRQMHEDPVQWGKVIIPGMSDGPRVTWPYSSSYMPTVSAYAPDKFATNGSLTQADDQISYYFMQSSSGNYKLGKRKLSEVAFPAGKVHMYEDTGRHFSKKEYFFTHRSARITMSMFDSSVSVRNTADANPGAYWTATGGKTPVIISYNEQTSWGYPLWPDTSPRDQPAVFRWTFKGLRGIDFGSKEAIN